MIMLKPFRRVGFSIASPIYLISAIFIEPLPPTSKFKKREDETDRQADRRRNADIDAEYNAVTCVAVYLLLMTFSQKGIERLQVHQEGMKMRDPEGRLEVSEGFDDGMNLMDVCSLQ